MDFVFDELVELTLVQCAESVETGAADDLFLESLEQTRSFFTFQAALSPGSQWSP